MRQRTTTTGHTDRQAVERDQGERRKESRGKKKDEMNRKWRGGEGRSDEEERDGQEVGRDNTGLSLETDRKKTVRKCRQNRKWTEKSDAFPHRWTRAPGEGGRGLAPVCSLSGRLPPHLSCSACRCTQSILEQQTTTNREYTHTQPITLLEDFRVGVKAAAPSS